MQYELVASLPAAEEILPLCEHEKIDLVLLDIMMRRGLDGLTVAQKLKQTHPEIKIILVTSMAEERWAALTEPQRLDRSGFEVLE